MRFEQAVRQSAGSCKATLGLPGGSHPMRKDLSPCEEAPEPWIISGRPCAMSSCLLLRRAKAATTPSWGRSSVLLLGSFSGTWVPFQEPEFLFRKWQKTNDGNRGTAAVAAAPPACGGGGGGSSFPPRRRRRRCRRRYKPVPLGPPDADNTASRTQATHIQYTHAPRVY